MNLGCCASSPSASRSSKTARESTASARILLDHTVVMIASLETTSPGCSGEEHQHVHHLGAEVNERLPARHEVEGGLDEPVAEEEALGRRARGCFAQRAQTYGAGLTGATPRSCGRLGSSGRVGPQTQTSRRPVASVRRAQFRSRRPHSGRSPTGRGGCPRLPASYTSAHTCVSSETRTRRGVTRTRLRPDGSRSQRTVPARR